MLSRAGRAVPERFLGVAGALVIVPGSARDMILSTAHATGGAVCTSWAPGFGSGKGGHSSFGRPSGPETLSLHGSSMASGCFGFG